MNNEEKLTKRLYGDYAGEEQKRLGKNSYFWLEYETTMTFLKKYLPKKGLILDAGGGPGRYTIELAKKGYKTIKYCGPLMIDNVFKFCYGILIFASFLISFSQQRSRNKIIY